MKSVSIALVAFVTAQSPPVIRGVVIDSAKKQPVARASVVLIRPDALADGIVVRSDDLGQFVFNGVPPGSYGLRAERDDYLRAEIVTVEVTAGEPSNVALTLTPEAVISGRVSNDLGEPIGRVFVRAFADTRLIAEARTNDLGEYRLFGLSPGAYVISAERYPGPRIETNSQIAPGRTIPGSSLVTPTPPCPDCRGEGIGRAPLSSVLPSGGFIDPGALTRETYPTVFYPGTTDRSAATPVRVAAGARIDAIDLTLVVVR